MRTILRIFSYLKKYPALSVIYLACSVISTLMLFVFPKITKYIIDDVIPDKDTKKLILLSFISLGAFLIRNVMDSLRIIFNNQLEQNVIFDMRSDLYERIQALPLSWFDNRRTGDLMTRVSEDVTNMERLIIDGMEHGLISFIQVTVVSVLLFYSNLNLGLIVMIPMPFLITGVIGYTLSAYKRHKIVREATSNMNSILHDNISGIRQIKAYSMEKSEHQRFNQSSSMVKKASLKVMRYWALYNPSMEFLNNLGNVLVMCFGGFMVVKGAISIGQLAEFLFLIALFYQPLNRIHTLNQLMQSSRAAAVRVFEIIDTQPEQDWEGHGKRLDKVIGRIEYKNVSFSFKPVIKKTKKNNFKTKDEDKNKGVKQTLENINIHINAGETIALVGHTGAGKSTIVNLLPRFYEYDFGDIKIDGVSINKLSKPYLREIISFVTQESYLFNGSVRENLLISKKNALDDELWEVLKVANAHEFVKKMPNGLDTNVGERGVKLSVGEKQRISIARAILRNTKILILDEATASVDNKTERLIQEALERLMKDRTSIVIAHRLSTIINADCIYVLEDGKIIQRGSHSELLKEKGLYKQLIEIGNTNLDWLTHNDDNYEFKPEI